MAQAPYKTRKQLGTSIAIESMDKLNELHKTTHIPKSKLIDKAIELLHESYKKEKQAL